MSSRVPNRENCCSPTTPALRERVQALGQASVTLRPPWMFELAPARERLERHLSAPLASFGLDGRPAAQAAAGAVLGYLEETQRTSLDHLTDVRFMHTDDCVLLDATTTRNLELTRNLTDGSTRATLLGTLDRTSTAMGGTPVEGSSDAAVAIETGHRGPPGCRVPTGDRVEAS